MKKILLIFTFLLALFLRTYRLADFPAGPNMDEVSQGYTAYSILKTGKDEWGQFLPLSPRSFGDYRAPLYTYLLIPAVAIFGLNDFAIRFPAAVIGSLAVIVLYFLVKELLKDEKLALAAAFFLAINPWHISLSRGAFEASLHVFFFPLGFWLFLKGLKNLRWLFLSSFILGVNLFSYYAPRFFTPLAVVLLLYFFRKEFFKKRINLIFVVIFALFLLLSVITFLSGGKTRVSDTSLWKPTDNWSGLAARQYEAVWNGLSPAEEKIFNNKISFVAVNFYKQYLDYFSPNFLFSRGPVEATYGMIPGRGVLYLYELPLIICSVYLIVKRKRKEEILILFLLFLSPMAAALAKGERAANRAIPMLPLWQILSALGLFGLWEFLKKRVSMTVFNFYFLAMSIVFLFFFLEDYFYHAPISNAPNMSYGWRQVSSFLEEKVNSYQTIVVSKKFSEPQIAIAYFLKIDPAIVQQFSPSWLSYQEKGLLFVDQLPEYNLGKFVFRNFHFPEDQKSDVLFIGKEEDFAGVKGNIEKIIYYPGPERKIALEVVSFNERK